MQGPDRFAISLDNCSHRRAASPWPPSNRPLIDFVRNVISLLNAGGPKFEGGEAEDESWLGGKRRRGTRGEADADAGRRETTASRRIRAADARHARHGDQRSPPVPARDDRFDNRGPAVKRGRFPEIKRKGRAKTRGRRRCRGRRQSGDCRDPVTQAATRAFARALERRKSDAPTLHTTYYALRTGGRRIDGWCAREKLGNLQSRLPLPRRARI